MKWLVCEAFLHGIDFYWCFARLPDCEEDRLNAVNRAGECMWALPEHISECVVSDGQMEKIKLSCSWRRGEATCRHNAHLVHVHCRLT